MRMISLIRDAEAATNGHYFLAMTWLERQVPRFAEAPAAIRLMRSKHRAHPECSRFRVDGDGFVRFFAPEPEPPAAIVGALPAATSRFVDAAVRLDPRISVRTLRGRSGPRHGFFVAGSTVAHRSAAAALRAIGGAA